LSIVESRRLASGEGLLSNWNWKAETTSCKEGRKEEEKEEEEKVE